jgi:adenylyltransferase/sulfurtransferase
MPSCAEGGVLGILPGLFGVIQATEVIKLILGIGRPLIGRLLTLDALDMRPREMRLQKNPDCPACGERASLKDLRALNYEMFCGVPQGEASNSEVTPGELAEMRRQRQQFTLLDVRDPHEWQICRIEGAVHIPLGELGSRLSELNTRDPIYVYCLMGGRSKKAQALLNGAGFSQVVNVAGGIRRWAQEVDTDLPVY